MLASIMGTLKGVAWGRHCSEISVNFYVTDTDMSRVDVISKRKLKLCVMSLLDYDNCTSCDTFVQALSDSVLAIFVIALSLNDAICRFDHL